MRTRGSYDWRKIQALHATSGDAVPAGRLRAYSGAVDGARGGFDSRRHGRLQTADAYTCPDGRKLPFAGERKTKTDRGFESTARVYECPDCGGCPLRKACFKSKDENARKRIQVNPRLTEFKQRASALLHTEKGSKLRKKRGVDVETVFGDIKRNYGFTRFTLRGLEKATLEFRLVAAGHNIRKLFRAQSAEMTGAGATE